MTMARDMQAEASDDDLLLRYAQGDRAAARVLTERLVPRVLAYASRLLAGDRAEAEDVAQEAMLRLWRAAPGWRTGEAKVSTWLYRVVTNLVTDRLRARGRRGGGHLPLDAAPEPADAAPGPLAQMIDGQRLDALNQALASLPERQREAVVLRHLEGLANPEIAAILGVGVEAVESLTARGKRALATALQGQREALGYEGR
jgi:RNA polymerase sigma factor (sigma-70 family)